LKICPPLLKTHLDFLSTRKHYLDWCLDLQTLYSAAIATCITSSSHLHSTVKVCLLFCLSCETISSVSVHFSCIPMD
jgi:hypothetical protein